MGILDKATGGFAGRLRGTGEETVRVVDYDKALEQEKKQASGQAKIEKAPRKKLRDLLPIKGSKNSPTDDEELDEIPDSVEQEEQEREDLDLAYKVATDTAFEIDDEQPFYIENNGSSNSPFEDLPEPSPGKKKKESEEIEYDENKINDVLEVLKIPATFVIGSDVLMPEDFKTVEFDLQVPQGYDIGQVEFFVERAEASIKEYLTLLEERNAHIAKLATTVDRLQVDLENLKFDTQIAAGIGIMPTSDNDELERDNLELRLQVKRLEDKLKAKTTMPDLSSKERQLYEDLRNQYSILEREKSALEQENSDLRSELARREEEEDDPTWMAGTQTRDSAMPMLGTEEDLKSEVPMGIEYVDEKPRQETPIPSQLPELDFSGGLPNPSASEEPNDFELPSFDMDIPTSRASSSVNSTFELDDDEPDYAPKTSSSSSDDDDDEDDELAKLMKGWN